MTTSQDGHDSFDESLTLNSQGRTFVSQKPQIGETDHDNPSEKRLRDETYKDLERTGDPGPASEYSVLLTVGSKQDVIVSENALKVARTCLFSSVETFSEEQCSDRDDSPTSSDPKFLGFVTAGTNKVIKVSDSALEAAKRRLHTIETDDLPSGSGLPDAENLDPSQFSVTCLTSCSERPSRALSGSATTPLTHRSPRSLFNPPLRNSAAIKSSNSVGSARMTSREKDVVKKLKDNMISSRITCIRDLRSCQLTSVDFLGIVVESAASFQNCFSSAPFLKVADRYGESISVEMLSSSIPPNISRGCVVSVDGALLRRTEEDISLIINESTFVDLEPDDPEAKCLHHLFRTGLFDNALSEESFTFDRSKLRVIGRLSEYPEEVSTVMARICNISSDSLVYLGCTSCKRSVTPTSNGVAPCQHCRNKKARYFYSLSMELADFTGVIVVNVSDAAAEKLIQKPAGGMVKLEKTVLETRLSSLYFRPMLFRISEQNSTWFVNEWKHLDIRKFKPFLRNIAEQKGYK